MRADSNAVHRLLLSLLLLVCCAVTCAASAAAATASEILHLYPEQPRAGERLLCGTTQLYRVHDLDATKVYDVKVSYPASVPTDFVLEVDTVQLPASLLRAYTAANDDEHDNDDSIEDPSAPRTMPVRRLNTAKLRLHPQELLLHTLRQTQAQQYAATYRLDVTAAVRAAQQQQRVTLDISLRAQVEGMSPVVDPRTRECVFDIVVEEMLLGGAFPHSTLALIAWLLLLLAAAFTWVYPFLLRKLTLELPSERAAHTVRFGDSASSSRKES